MGNKHSRSRSTPLKPGDDSLHKQSNRRWSVNGQPNTKLSPSITRRRYSEFKSAEDLEATPERPKITKVNVNNTKKLKKIRRVIKPEAKTKFAYKTSPKPKNLPVTEIANLEESYDKNNIIHNQKVLNSVQTKKLKLIQRKVPVKIIAFQNEEKAENTKLDFKGTSFAVNLLARYNHHEHKEKYRRSNSVAIKLFRIERNNFKKYL